MLQSGKRRDPSIGQKERVEKKEGIIFMKVGRFDRKEEIGKGWGGKRQPSRARSVPWGRVPGLQETKSASRLNLEDRAKVLLSVLNHGPERRG